MNNEYKDHSIKVLAITDVQNIEDYIEVYICTRDTKLPDEENKQQEILLFKSDEMDLVDVYEVTESILNDLAKYCNTSKSILLKHQNNEGG